MDCVRPVNQNNAIKIAAIAIEFSDVFKESDYQNAISLYQKDKGLVSELPRKQQQAAVTFQVNNPQSFQNQALGGVVFDRLAPNGLQEWAITMRHNSFIVTCGVYSRWDIIWPKAQSFIKKFSTIIEDMKVSAAGIEYVDEFYINEKDPTWKESLFKTNSKYLPSNINDLNDLWHSHHGYFSNEGYTNESRTLTKIETDYVLEESEIGKTKISIKSHHRSELQNLMTTTDFISKGTFRSMVVGNHGMNKRILVDLLSDNILKKISLGI
jgi:uncharacterized protein (TIGR04255 family)